jgi:hypothetical protein
MITHTESKEEEGRREGEKGRPERSGENMK